MELIMTKSNFKI